MAAMDFGEYQDMVEDTAVATRMVEFRATTGHLVAACLTDRMVDGLSLCYSFFDPADSRRSLGSYIVLWHIGHARASGLRHVYLGYWIADSPKMSYKTRFRPMEGLMLAVQGWRDLDELTGSGSTPPGGHSRDQGVATLSTAVPSTKISSTRSL